VEIKMKYEYAEVNKSPVVWADNFYSAEEIQEMFFEARYINSLGILSEEDESGGARENGKLLKKNKAVFLEKIYASEPRLSGMIRMVNKKLSDKNFIDRMTDMHPYFNNLKNADGSILLNYYDKSDKYEAHRDTCYITILTWFYEQPKAFEGGDFIIENDYKIDCKIGRTVFMPSYLLHEVTPVTMPETEQGKGLGRYSLTLFIGGR
tara:strand:- start:167 stop:787 length:621 start_codon:yes stop_codon:yes gene_type:complete